MIIHSPIISGSLTFAQGATMVSSDSGVSGSFSGSFQGDGSQLTNVAASGLNIDLLNEGPITGDDFILFSDQSDSGTEKRATFKTALDSEGVFSGSAQVQGEVGGDLIPDTHNAYDLGSTTKYWRDLYLSSGSLYINGQQVLSTTGTELRITTDAGESIKILEAGNDTITLETENGDITLTASGTGNIELDAPIQIAAGNQVLSSDGNPILFGEDINAQSNRISANNIGNVAGTSTFTGSFVGDGTALSGVTSYTDADNTAHLDSLAVVSGSASEVRTFINVEDGATADQTGAEIKTALFNESDTNNLTDTLLSKLNGIEATADITDTANVTAAGALMDSELTDLDGVKGVTISTLQVKPSEGAFANGDKTKLDGIEANADVTDTANVKTALNASLGGTQTIGDSSDTITIAGNLTVSGTTTTVNSNAVSIGDNIIVLNSDESGTPSQNGGIEIERGTSDNVVFQFNEGTDRWQFTNDGSTYFNLPTSTADVAEFSNLYYTDARVKTKLDAETVISGSSQVVLQSADKTGFTGASSITTLGTVTAGDVAQILPSGVVSGSAQVQELGGVNDNTITLTAGAGLNGGGSITLNQDSDETITFTVADGVVSGSDQLQDLGALMDSEVTNLDEVKAFDSSDYATAAQGTLADSAQQPPSEGAFVDGDKTKLDGIEASADVTDTANVTAAGALMDSELTDLAGVKAVTISTLQPKPSEGAFANGDKTKLDGIEASADVTDTANVTAAGAVMDSEVTDLDGIKSLTVPNDTTISTFGASLVDDANEAAGRTTLGLGTSDTVEFGIVSASTDLYFEGNLIGSSTSTGSFGRLEVNASTIKIGNQEIGQTEAATLNSTSGTNTGDVTLAGSYDYLSISGQEITLGQVDAAADISNLTTSNVSEGSNEYFTEARAQSALSSHTDSTSNPHSVTATQVGLGNVDNTSDANKPVSTATQTALDLKANLASPDLTGNPTAPTQTGTDDSTKIATTAFVQDRIDTIIGTAGSTLDTLGELSASLSDDEDALTALTTTVGGKLQKDQNLSDLTDASTARTNLGVDAAGTDNSTNVTLAGGSYLSISGQEITAGTVDISSHTNLAVSDTTGQTGIDVTLSGDTISATVSGLTTTSAVQFGTVGVGGAVSDGFELKVTGDIAATGDVVAFQSSDERLKDNIKLISNPIEKVKELRGVTWEWNEEASIAAKQTPNVGVIAQEVEKVLPELVHDRENGYKGVDYSKLTGLLIEVVKTQQEKIEILESRLDKLEN